MNNFRKYLPSKNFIFILLVIIVLAVLFFTARETISFFKSKKSAKNNGSQIQMTVGDVIQKDSNTNGIADWEEYLWGLDPNKNGEENKEFILSKKRALTQSGEISNTDDSKEITDNEMLSREFFATIVSLQQTDSLNEESIKSISNAIGQKIEAVPLVDVYKSADLIIKNDSTEANNAYLSAYNNLVNKYANKDIGKELTIISQGLSSNDLQALYVARSIASAYISFSDEFIKIPVPKSIASIHLDLANNYNKTGQSVGGLTQIFSDPILGMRSVINYKKYSDEMVSDIEKLGEFLQ